MRKGTMESLTVPAALDSLARISEFIVDATTRAGLDDHAAWQVQLAVDEAATNIIQHGYSVDSSGVITLTWNIENETFFVSLRDTGRRFNPHDVPPPDILSPLEERQAGGLGLYLMNQLMDTVHFDFDDKRGNLLTMTKHIDRARKPANIFALSGRLDAVSTNEVLGRVKVAIADGAGQVLLDMAGVSFLSSSGLRALLLLRKDL